MTGKKLIFQAHKILGLTTGLVVFIVAITGCCFAFKNEIESFYKGYKKVKPQNSKIISVSQANEIAQDIFPENHIHGLIYKRATDAIEVVFYDRAPEFYQSIFLNPYTGEIIQIDNHLSGFFAFILKGHMRLWLPREIGEQVVGVSVLLFIVILITGFILWFPKKQKNLKNKIRFVWKKTTGWKRKNFDIHAVVGFYLLPLALVIAFTGALISYNWLKYIVYKSTGGTKEMRFDIPKNKSEKISDPQLKPIDQIIPLLKRENPTATSFELHFPKTTEESIYIETINSEGLFYDADFRFFDQNTLEEIETTAIYGKYKNAKLADKILRMNYDIHIGAIGGIFGKIIAFLISLGIASLPMTGILLWYGRTYKKSSS